MLVAILLLLLGAACIVWITRQRFPEFQKLSDVCQPSSLDDAKRTFDGTIGAHPGEAVYAITGATGLIGTKLVETLLEMWEGNAYDSFPKDLLTSILSELPPGTLRLLLRPSAENQLKLKLWKQRWPKANFEPIWGVGQSFLACKLFIDESVSFLFHIAAAGGDWYAPRHLTYTVTLQATR